jgi:hypothetical protein
MLLVAMLIFLHVDPIIAVRGLSFAFHAALIIFIWNFMRGRYGPFVAVLACALIAASWPMLVWDLGGLESVPFAALLASGTLVTLRCIEKGQRSDLLTGGVLLGFALFMRPDGGIVAAIALGSFLCFGPGRPARRWIDTVLAGALCALIMVPWEIFRIFYFHDYLPNTYYAKIVGIPLAWRIRSGLGYWRTYVAKPPYFVPLLLFVALLLLYRRRASKFDIALWMCILGYAVYLVDIGGDHMLAYRFMVPLVPLFAVALTGGMAELGWLDRPAIAAFVSAVLMIACARQAAHWLQNPMYRDTAGMKGEEIGHYVNSHWKAGSLVALNVAGATPYFADDLNYIDMLGLNDKIISRRTAIPMDGPWVHLVGHLKGNGQSILDRRPDFVILGGPEGRLANSGLQAFLGDYELQQLPGFIAGYKACISTLRLDPFAYDQLQKAEGNANPELSFIYYQRRDLSAACVSPKS